MRLPAKGERAALFDDVLLKGAVLCDSIDHHAATIARQTAVSWGAAELICQRHPGWLDFYDAVTGGALDLERVSQDDPAFGQDAVGALVAAAELGALCCLVVDRDPQGRHLGIDAPRAG